MRFRLLLLALAGLASTGVIFISKPPAIDTSITYSRIGAGTFQITPICRHVGSTALYGWSDEFGSACGGLEFDATDILAPTLTTDGSTGQCRLLFNCTDALGRTTPKFIDAAVYGDCSNGLDDDENGLIDFDGGARLDLDNNGFVDAAFNAETPAVTAADPGCASPFGATEGSAQPDEEECVSGEEDSGDFLSTGLYTLDISSIYEEGAVYYSAVTCGNNAAVGGSGVTVGTMISNGNNLDPSVIGARNYYRVAGEEHTSLVAGCGSGRTTISVTTCKIPNAVVPPTPVAVSSGGKDNQATWTGASTTPSTSAMIVRSLHMAPPGGTLSTLPYGAEGSTPVVASDGTATSVDRRLLAAGQSDTGSATFSAGRSGVYLGAQFETTTAGAPTPDPSLQVEPASISVESSATADAPTATIYITNVGEDGSVMAWSLAPSGTPQSCVGTTGTGWIQASDSGGGLQPPNPLAVPIPFVDSGAGCAPGTYTATVCVSATGVINSPQCRVVTLVRTSGNAPPTEVDAGPNQSIPGGGLVQLDGTFIDIDDPNPDVSWDFTSGSCSGLSATDIDDPTFTISDTPQSCVAEFCVDDGTNPEVCDSVTITVPAQSEPSACDEGPQSILTTANGISITLDDAYPCAKNVDGTYSIFSPTGAIVESITPAYVPGSKRNGYEVRTRQQSGATNCSDPWEERLDTRITGRFGTDGCRYISWIEPDSLPLAIPANRSLIKVISHLPGSGSCAGVDTDGCLATATAFTFLASDEVPGCANRIRPPSVGTVKPQYCADGWDMDDLPDLALISNQGPWTMEFAKTALLGQEGTIWGIPDTYSSLATNQMVPVDALLSSNGDTFNSPAGRYGTPLTNTVHAVAARMLQTGSDADKFQLAWRLVQVGVDTWGMMNAGKGYFADGGIHSGRVIPTLIAWYFTQDDALLSKMGCADCFQENGASYFSTVVPRQAQWGRTGGGCISSDAGVGGLGQNRWCPGNANDNRNGGGIYNSGGNVGGSSACPVSSTATRSQKAPTVAQQEADGCWTLTKYQQHTHKDLGALAIARHLPGVPRAWNWEPFFMLWERNFYPPWVAEVGDSSPCVSHCSGFLAKFAATYQDVGQCNDGIDNNNDGVYDYPEDLGCSSPWDATEG